MRLQCDMERQGAAPALPGGGAALVAFMSFAVSRGFGAQHPLLALADRLHHTHDVRLGPLTTFYDATVEDREDERKLGMAWQPAGPLRETLEALVAAMAADEAARVLARRGAAEGLADEAAALIPTLRAAEAAGARVRLTYTL